MFTRKGDIDALRDCLEPKGVREAALSRAWEFYSDALGGSHVAGENGAEEMEPPRPDAISLPASADLWAPGVAEGLREAQFQRFLKVRALQLSLRLTANRSHAVAPSAA